MEHYKCLPGVRRKCPDALGCDGTYMGVDCDCAIENQNYMPSTEREELLDYRTIGTVEEICAALHRIAEDDKAREEGRLAILPSAALEQRTIVEMTMGFKLYNWQAAYIWADSNYIPPGRMVGRSTAFALRMLLVPGETLYVYPGGRHSHLSDGAASGYEYIRRFQRFLQGIYRQLLQSHQPLVLRRVYFSLREVKSLGGEEDD